MQIRRWLLGDWQLKLAGLLVALALWVYVRTEQMMQLTLNVPLELRNPPRAMQVVGKVPARVEVRLTARRDVVSELDSGSVRAVVDLAEVQGTGGVIVLEAGHIERPRGVGVLNIVPRQIEVKMAKVPARRR